MDYLGKTLNNETHLFKFKQSCFLSYASKQQTLTQKVTLNSKVYLNQLVVSWLIILIKQGDVDCCWCLQHCCCAVADVWAPVDCPGNCWSQLRKGLMQSAASTHRVEAWNGWNMLLWWLNPDSGQYFNLNSHINFIVDKLSKNIKSIDCFHTSWLIDWLLRDDTLHDDSLG